MISGWRGFAFNQSPNSSNEIHGDKIAKQYGFTGGLVPGVTISSYLIHPAVESWGFDWLDRGSAHVRVTSPLYDEEAFEVIVDGAGKRDYHARLIRPDGTVSANAEVALPEVAAPAPVRRADIIAEPGYVGSAASPERWQMLKQEGCRAFRFHWGSKNNMQTYLREIEGMPALLRGDRDGYANMAYLLGCSNWILAGNAYMNPWVHLETKSQNYRRVPADTAIVAEMQVADFYEKKEHRFVDVNVSLFDEKDDQCLTAIELRAIYQLRGM